MSFFKKLFGKSTDPAPSSSQNVQSLTPEENFHKEFKAVLPRYLSKPGAVANMQMRNETTNAIIPFTEAFPEAFEQWKTIQSSYDRRGLIYSVLDDYYQKDMKMWQIMERFTDDRYPQQAMEWAKRITEEDAKSPDYWSALAKAFLVLTDYVEAEKSAREALSIDASHYRAKTVLADTLHISGKHKEAHALYDEILQARMPRNETKMSLQRLVGFDGDILFSPIYALAWLQSHPDVTIDTWNWANDEFYFSPHFRAEFAYYLLNQKETMKGFVKLFTLAKEMPWVKEAVINSYNLIHQLGMTDRMTDEIAWLESVMKSNGWDAKEHGLHTRKVKH